MHLISPQGVYKTLKIGKDLDEQSQPFRVVPAGYRFASESLGVFSLVGCKASPGFDFEDFELADRVELINIYPQHDEIITRLTR